MATDFLTGIEKTLMTDDFADFVGDGQIRVSITYKAFSSKGTFSPSGGSVAITYSDSTVNAIRIPISDREIELSNGKYQVGDYRYMIKVSDIATPKKDDRIVDGSITRFLVSWTTDLLRIFHSIVTRNLG